VNAKDTEVVRNLRRELGRRAIDTTRMDIAVNNGRVSITGTVTHIRMHPEANLEDELELFRKAFQRDKLIKELSIQVTIKKPEPKEDEHADPRGRMRH
jgi:hypothetical protein